MISAEYFPLGCGNSCVCIELSPSWQATAAPSSCAFALVPPLPLLPRERQAWETQAGFMQAAAQPVPETKSLGKAVKRYPQSININQLTCWFNTRTQYPGKWKPKCLQLINQLLQSLVKVNAYTKPAARVASTYLLSVLSNTFPKSHTARPPSFQHRTVYCNRAACTGNWHFTLLATLETQIGSLCYLYIFIIGTFSTKSHFAHNKLMN